MKKILLNIAFTLIGFSAFAQIGISTTNPKTTLDVVGEATTVEKADGIMAPRITGDQLRMKTAYGTEQTSAIVYVTMPDSAPAGATIHVTKAGYYYFDGTVWQEISTNSSESPWNNADGSPANQNSTDLQYLEGAMAINAPFSVINNKGVNLGVTIFHKNQTIGEQEGGESIYMMNDDVGHWVQDVFGSGAGNTSNQSMRFFVREFQEEEGFTVPVRNIMQLHTSGELSFVEYGKGTFDDNIPSKLIGVKSNGMVVEVDPSIAAGKKTVSKIIPAGQTVDVVEIGNLLHGVLAARVATTVQTAHFGVAKTYEIANAYGSDPVTTKIIDTGAQNTNDYDVSFTATGGASFKITVTNNSTTIDADFYMEIDATHTPRHNYTVTEL